MGYTCLCYAVLLQKVHISNEVLPYSGACVLP